MTNKEEIAARYRKWIAALRSGKYKQGRGELRPEKDKFCCLGVLVDLGDHTKRTSEGWITSQGCVMFHENYPPHYVEKALNLDSHSDKLAILNDVKKLSFNEIADYIETEILPRFL